MTISRRSVTTGAAALALSACANTPADQRAADIQTIVVGVAGLAAALAAIPGTHVPPMTLNQINDQVQAIDSIAVQISQPGGSAKIGAFVGAVTALGELVQPYAPEAPAIAAAAAAAASLAQVIATESGLVSAPSAHRRWTMAPEAARTLLKAQAHK